MSASALRDVVRVRREPGEREARHRGAQRHVPLPAPATSRGCPAGCLKHRGASESDRDHRRLHWRMFLASNFTAVVPDRVFPYVSFPLDPDWSRELAVRRRGDEAWLGEDVRRGGERRGGRERCALHEAGLRDLKGDARPQHGPDVRGEKHFTVLLTRTQKL